MFTVSALARGNSRENEKSLELCSPEDPEQLQQLEHQRLLNLLTGDGPFHRQVGDHPVIAGDVA